MHKSGFVNIIGNPNVGKSTLSNAILGERLSIITSKAQTTRHRILGIFNDENHQIIFSDTPGVLKPAYAMQESMMKWVRSALEDADILLYLTEVGDKGLADENIEAKVKAMDVPLYLIINKIDTTTQEELEAHISHWKERMPRAEIRCISALLGHGVPELLDELKEKLPEGPAFFPKDSLTDKPERFFVSEIIREKILMNYNKEVPYSVEIETESFKEDVDIIRIRAIIYVARESQKGIIIGHKGSALKRVGIQAREDMESFFGKKIHLETFVKVAKEWRNSERQLKRFGYE